MKQCIWAWVLATLLVPAMAFSQEMKPKNAMQDMEQRGMELKLQAHKAEVEFQQRLRELELQEREQELAGQMDDDDDMEGGPLAVLLIVCSIIHVLVAIWIYQDIRQRNAGSGLWIVIGLLAGLPGALVYAVVRLGDMGNGKKGATTR